MQPTRSPRLETETRDDGQRSTYRCPSHAARARPIMAAQRSAALVPARESALVVHGTASGVLIMHVARSPFVALDLTCTKSGEIGVSIGTAASPVERTLAGARITLVLRCSTMSVRSSCGAGRGHQVASEASTRPLGRPSLPPRRVMSSSSGNVSWESLAFAGTAMILHRSASWARERTRMAPARLPEWQDSTGRLQTSQSSTAAWRCIVARREGGKRVRGSLHPLLDLINGASA